ncbi:sigma factor-like helix-turn-helix DNA-binding protein [Eubacterium sp.]|uniref:sigma factor-like helix-turn-helix DNA-binding protein n=1 Tax=Eubacterium sp. TaxID=142586 RepID=UPI0030D74BC3
MTSEERQRKVRWLMRYRIAEKRIKRLEAEKERWRERATRTTTAPTYFKYIDKQEDKDKLTKEQRRRNEMPPVIVRGGKHLTLEDIVAEMDALDRELQETIYRATALRRDIGQAIDALSDDRERLVLYYKYVDGLYLEEICVRMGYSYKHIKYLHTKALENLKLVPQGATEMC